MVKVWGKIFGEEIMIANCDKEHKISPKCYSPLLSAYSKPNPSRFATYEEGLDDTEMTGSKTESPRVQAPRSN